MRNTKFSRLQPILVGMATLAISIPVFSSTALALSCVTGSDSGLATFNQLFRCGPKIAHAYTDWVPQGLAYWPAQDWLIESYYDKDSGMGRLAITNRSTSAYIKTVKVKNRAGDYLAGSSNHMGGVAVGGNYLWISTKFGNSNIFRISLSTLRSASNGSSVSANWQGEVSANSYITVSGAFLYVGDFENDKMYKYQLSDAGVIGSRVATIQTPNKTQGVAIANGYYFYSCSEGRTVLSKLNVVKISSGQTRTINLPNMSEGAVIAAGRLYVTFESTANKYPGATRETKNYVYASISSLLP